MIAADQFSAPHKEYLYHRILLPEILALVHIHSNNIPVFLTVSSDLLAFSDFPDTLDQIPVFRRVFKPHFF